MCNSFEFRGANSIGVVIDDAAINRRVNVHRMAFPFDVVVDVGAQCKFNVFPFAMNMFGDCNVGKSFASFVVIELVTSSEC